MKILKWLGWASAATGALLIVLGSISEVFSVNPLHVAHIHSIFITASSFLLLAITTMMYCKDCCQDCCKDDKSKA